ncbi:Hsp20 family protein [Halobacteriovorax sp. GFR7]|uniref:Hsp20 family protein n=1 Tax=unclassified Halobacteriovorax TaxID=2639665 RepID=UPI003D977926
MRIEDSNQFTKQNLKLKNERDRLIKDKKQEIESIRKNYNQMANDQRIIGEEKLDSVRDQNQVAIIESLNNKEARLNDIKESLEKTGQQFAKQESFAKLQSDANIDSIRDNYQQQLEYVHQRGRDDLEDTTNTVNDLANKIKYDNEEFIIDETAKAKNLANEISVRNDGFIQRINKQFDERVQKLSKENSTTVKGLEKEQRNEMSKLKSDHYQKLTQTGAFQQNELKTQKAFHEDTVKSRKDAFEQKYAALQKEHQGLMGRLKAKIDEELNSLKNYYTKAKETIQEKGQDSFYNITKLEPSIKSDQNFYYFSLEVPKHEQETIHINAQERGITVTQNRKFDQRVEENGNTFKSKRSESLVRQFDVPDILDGTKVSRNYDTETSTLTYRIAKR